VLQGSARHVQGRRAVLEFAVMMSREDLIFMALLCVLAAVGLIVEWWHDGRSVKRKRKPSKSDWFPPMGGAPHV
jgi:hypothetical protein